MLLFFFQFGLLTTFFAQIVKDCDFIEIDFFFVKSIWIKKMEFAFVFPWNWFYWKKKKKEKIILWRVFSWNRHAHLPQRKKISWNQLVNYSISSKIVAFTKFFRIDEKSIKQDAIIYNNSIFYISSRKELCFWMI